MASQSDVSTESSDRDLLGQYQRSRDEVAFRELVERHHGMVYGIARQMLGCPHAAEDVLQATFMVLARDAKKIRKRGSLASWLYGVAFRTAARLAKQRARAASQSFEDEAVTTTDPLEKLSNQFEQNCVLEELNRLPDKLRTALVLRYLGDKTNAEVAEEMQLSESAVEGRLKRGRNQLRMRLARQGVTIAAAVVFLDSIHHSAEATECSHIVAKTVETALGKASGDVVGAESEALRIAEQELAKMATTKMIQTAVAAAIAASVVGGGFALSGGTQLWAQNGGRNPLGEVVVENTQSDDRKQIGETSGTFRAKQRTPASNPFGMGNVSRLQKLVQRIHSLGHFNVPVETEAEVVILEALRRRMTSPLQFDEVPLSEALMVVRDEYSIPIHIDRTAIEEEAIDPQTDAITCDIANIKLSNGLTLMLEPLNLTTVIRNEVLVVTTKTRAEETLLTRVYKMTPTWQMTQDQMLDAITTSVLPNSWSTVGGPGSFTKIENGLVINNTREAHNGINKLLGQIDRLYGGTRPVLTDESADQAAPVTAAKNVTPTSGSDPFGGNADPFAD